MNYLFHPGAEQDVADGQDFYIQHAGLRMATRFLDELQRIIQLLLQYSGPGTPMSKNRRAFPFKGFPYSVLYSANDGHLHILIVRHHSRKPGFANNRH